MGKAKIDKELTERQRNRRARILETARSLLTERGYDALTMRDLAAESEVALKTLYRIYGDKDALLRTAIQEQYRVEYETLDEDDQHFGLDRVFFIAEAMSARVLDEASYIKALARMTSSEAILDPLRELRTTTYARGLDQMGTQGALEEFVDTRFLASLLGLHISALFRLWANGGLESHELVDRVRLEIACVLSPFATGASSERLRELSKRIHDKIAEQRLSLTAKS
ncbi:MAG: helix-turn-helix domain-containing protein [Pseudomonadota bacterium]